MIRLYEFLYNGPLEPHSVHKKEIKELLEQRALTNGWKPGYIILEETRIESLTDFQCFYSVYGELKNDQTPNNPPN